MFRLILSGPGHPHWNMALDEALLRLSNDRLTVRLYGWDPPGLSLGYFQRAGDVDARAVASAGYVLTRRITGGGAIPHARELTYALVAEKPARGNRALYSLANDALIRALGSFGIEARERGAGDGGEGFLCFRRHADFDVVVDRCKVAGSAQRLRGGRVLQHGSLLLEAPPPLPGLEAEDVPLAGRGLTAEEVAPALHRAFERVTAVRIPPAPPTDAEQALAEELRENKYGSQGWIFRR
jgi:lipoate-protein ligase A